MHDTARQEPVLKISYNCGKGHMTILLPDFLERQGLSKIRKLLKFIKTSDTPDELEKVSAYINAENETFDSRMKNYANEAIAAQTKVTELQPKLEYLIMTKADYEKKSKQYKFLSEEIKALRNKIRDYNATFRHCKTEIRRLQRNKEKFRKIM